MIEHHLDTTDAILLIRPKSALEQADFEQLAQAVDPHIASTGDLAGLIVETPGFPGWSSFGAMAAHLRFVRDHHKHIHKIALVTDSAIGNVAEHLVSHFVSAEIKQFPALAVESARQWILDRPLRTGHRVLGQSTHWTNVRSLLSQNRLADRTRVGETLIRRPSR